MIIKIKFSKVLIIGSGPSGLTSSLYIVRSRINPINITGRYLGGQLSKTYIIENWPSVKFIKGSDLMFNFLQQLLNVNLEIYNDEIYFFNFLNIPFFLFGKKNFFICYFIIICTGSFYKNFNIKNYLKYNNKNISNCATCDANLYNNKKVCVVGGGDSCFENLFYLLKFPRKIIFINRNKIFKSNLNSIKKLFYMNLKKIIFKINYFIIEFIGDDFFLIYLKIKNFFNFNTIIIYLNGLFIFIGNLSNSIFFLGQIKIKNSFILTKKNNSYNYLSTSIKNIYASGDVQDFFYKQAITSSSSGCVSYFNLINFYNNFF